MDSNRINVLVLAYLGDAIYEVYIREYLIKQGINKVNDLQNEAIKYVSAKGQARYLDELIQSSFFTEEEIDVIKRARNSKSGSHPRNTDILTYKHATAFEALLGYLYFSKRQERIEEIINYIIGEK